MVASVVFGFISAANGWLFVIALISVYAFFRIRAYCKRKNAISPGWYKESVFYKIICFTCDHPVIYRSLCLIFMVVIFVIALV